MHRRHRNNGAANEEIRVLAAASINSLATATVLSRVLVFATNGASCTIIGKGTAAQGGWFLRAPEGQNGDLRFLVSTSGTDLSAQSRGGQYVSNVPIFVGCQWVVGGASTDQRLFIGRANAPAREPTAYATQAAGGASKDDDSATNLTIGNTSSGAGLSFWGLIFWVGLWNRTLSLGEIRDQQLNPHPTSGCVGMWWPGQNGYYARDYSGFDNHGVFSEARPSLWPPHGPYDPAAMRGVFPPNQVVSAQTVRPR